MSDRVFDSTMGALNTSLNIRQLKQNVTSSNIANADTPGYKAQTVEFEQAFRDALGVSQDMKPAGDHARHIVPRDTDPIEPEIYDDPNGVESLDGNTVARAKEMAEMAENQQMYDVGVELLKRKLGLVKYGVTEGGGNK
jgi:flagellar basal-body rod protein FlgB